jgi:hypothetical protein
MQKIVKYVYSREEIPTASRDFFQAVWVKFFQQDGRDPVGLWIKKTTKSLREEYGCSLSFLWSY